MLRVSRLAIPAVEDHAPLPDAEAPEVLRPAQAPDVAIGQCAVRGANALAIAPTASPQGLQCSRADFNPPAARFSQR